MIRVIANVTNCVVTSKAMHKKFRKILRSPASLAIYGFTRQTVRFNFTCLALCVINRVILPLEHSHIRLSLGALKSAEEKVIIVFPLSVFPLFLH